MNFPQLCGLEIIINTERVEEKDHPSFLDCKAILFIYWFLLQISLLPTSHTSYLMFCIP